MALSSSMALRRAGAYRLLFSNLIRPASVSRSFNTNARVVDVERRSDRSVSRRRDPSPSFFPVKLLIKCSRNIPVSFLGNKCLIFFFLMHVWFCINCRCVGSLFAAKESEPSAELNGPILGQPICVSRLSERLACQGR